MASRHLTVTVALAVLLLTSVVAVDALGAPDALGAADGKHSTGPSALDLDLGLDLAPPPKKKKAPNDAVDAPGDSLLEPQPPSPTEEGKSGTIRGMLPAHPDDEPEPDWLGGDQDILGEQGVSNGDQRFDQSWGDFSEGEVPAEQGGLFPGEESLPVYSSGTWFWKGRWYTRQDLMMLIKSKPRRAVLAVNQDIDAGADKVRDLNLNLPFFTTAKARFGYEPGTKLTIGRMLGRDAGNRDKMVEFSFMGLFDFDTQSAVVPIANNNLITALSPGGTASPGFPGFNDAVRQSFAYWSDMDSYELNVRLRSRPSRDRMVGQPDGTWVRHGAPSRLYTSYGGLVYMGVDEQFRYNSEGADPNTNSGELIVRTHNNMVGLQLGGGMTEQYTEWKWGLRGRIGGLVNFGERRSRLVTTVEGGGVNRVQDIFDEQMVFLLQGGFFAAYQLRPNVALRAGYDFFYVQGIALAPENIGLSDAGFPHFNLGGGVLYHGPSIGFEIIR